MLLYLQSLVFGLCNRPLDGFVFFRGDLYGFFVLCKLRPQGRLFLFAGQFFDMRLYVAAFEMLPAVLLVPKYGLQGGGGFGLFLKAYKFP